MMPAHLEEEFVSGLFMLLAMAYTFPTNCIEQL